MHSLYEWFGQKLNSESTLKEDRVCAEQILVNSLIIIDAMSGFLMFCSSSFCLKDFPYTLWLFNSSPWKITMLLIGKPSISISAIYTMAMLVITRGQYVGIQKIYI